MVETKPQPANGGESLSTWGTLARRLAVAAPLAALGLGLLAWAVFSRPARDAVEPRPQATVDRSEKSVATALPAYPLGDLSRWLPDIPSMFLQAEARFETEPDVIAKNLRKLKKQYPDLRDPDPLVFTQLLPVLRLTEEWGFDRSRLRYLSVRHTEDNRDLLRDLRVWDGKRAVMLWRQSNPTQDSFRLAAKPDWVAKGLLSLNYLSKQAPVFWWNNTEDAKREFEQRCGTPADYVLVGQETYHGVECHVLLSAVGNQSDRYYVGVADGRWYGAKEGIIALPRDLARAHQLAVEEFLREKLGNDPSDDVWAKIGEKLRSLPQDQKVDWCRLHYARVVKDYTPVFEYWFSDFRDIGKGPVFPYREELLFYGHEGHENSFVECKRTVTVKEISIGQPLADDLFREQLTEGASVIDETHQPTLHYTLKAKFTAEEWQAIVKRAADEAEKEAASARSVTQLIGKPAPPLPAGGWINSEPLRWGDLRGKIVVLKFWAVGCAPCYEELPVLKNALPPDDSRALPPIVFIGVHAPGNGREEVEEVISKHKLKAPIFIDKGTAESAVGKFFDGCAVTAMPTSVAVDEEGRILAHGSFSEVLAVAEQRRNKSSLKK